MAIYTRKRLTLPSKYFKPIKMSTELSSNILKCRHVKVSPHLKGTTCTPRHLIAAKVLWSIEAKIIIVSKTETSLPFAKIPQDYLKKVNYKWQAFQNYQKKAQIIAQIKEATTDLSIPKTISNLIDLPILIQIYLRSWQQS